MDSSSLIIPAVLAALIPVAVLFCPPGCGCEEIASFLIGATYLPVSFDTNVLPVSALSLPPYKESLNERCEKAEKLINNNTTKTGTFISGILRNMMNVKY